MSSSVSPLPARMLSTAPTACWPGVSANTAARAGPARHAKIAPSPSQAQARRAACRFTGAPRALPRRSRSRLLAQAAVVHLVGVLIGGRRILLGLLRGLQRLLRRLQRLVGLRLALISGCHR